MHRITNFGPDMCLHLQSRISPMAIVDTLGPAGAIFHKIQTFTICSLVFTGCFLKFQASFEMEPFCCAHEHTKAPFESMKDADLKHLTFKTTFLLALASTKCYSKIHAWVANKVLNLGQWEKVALFPSSDFIAKNQLARIGSQSLSPVPIPALSTIVDR